MAFLSPSNPGEYPYLCTVPGHWVRMQGVLHVVEDVEQWSRENADKIFAGQASRNVRPRNWKLSDLVGDLPNLASGRSRDRGKELFAANCRFCHRLDGVGSADVGPDLVEASGRLEPTEMLAEILMPSKKIDEAYRSWIISCRDDEVHYGMIVEQTTEWIRVVENPRVDPVGVRVPRSTILDMHPSSTSTMPMGILNTLSREQILDLLAYGRAVEN